MVTKDEYIRNFDAAYETVASTLQSIAGPFNLADSPETEAARDQQVLQATRRYHGLMDEPTPTPDAATEALFGMTVMLTDQNLYGRLAAKAMVEYGSDQAPYSLPHDSRLMIELVARQAEEALATRIRMPRSINQLYWCAGMAIGNAWATEALVIEDKTDLLHHGKTTLDTDILEQNSDLFKLPAAGEVETTLDDIDAQLASAAGRLAVPAVAQAADIVVARFGSLSVSPSVEDELLRPIVTELSSDNMTGMHYFTFGIKPGATLLLNAAFANQ